MDPDSNTGSRRDGPSAISRRAFLTSTAVAVAGLGGLGRLGRAVAQTSTLPDPALSGIEHVVVVMMENRSFDHMLGWLPHADGEQRALAYADADGVLHRTHRLAPDFQGCGHPDPDHSYVGGRVELNGGACDGWLRAGANDEYAIGYYTRQDLNFLGRAAPSWTACDHYFSSIMAETFPNRFHLHAAQTDRIENSLAPSTLPTIWDRLGAAGITGRYYWSDVPFLALWGTRYLSISAPFAAFLVDCATGALPAVSFVEPRFLAAEEGLSGDDHPHADIRNGEAFMNLVYEAVTASPAWPSTVLVYTYDEWGGFFDHVPPAAAPITPAEQAGGNQDGLRGFRVPSVLVSPFARRGHVSHLTFDHASILRMIEWRWNLPSLTPRDATATNLAEALDFARPDLSAKRFNVPAGPFGGLCGIPVIDKWEALRVIAAGLGWLGG